MLFIISWVLPHNIWAECYPRPEDELWEISTRHITCYPCINEFSTDRFSVNRQDHCNWNRSTFADLLLSMGKSPMRTIVYTHGNWMTYSNARLRANVVYQALSARAGEPVRFIAFTWPSHRVRDWRPVQDIREKAERSEAEAIGFAHFLREIPKNQPLGLIGYSFGSRVTCGGLQLIMGGALNGHCLPNSLEPLPFVRVSLIAPAFEQHWLARGQHYGQVLDGVERLVNVYNSRDPILKRYRFLEEDSSPLAAGFAGIANIPGGTSDPLSTTPLQPDARIIQFDCRNSIGGTHGELSFYQKCPAFCQAIDNVLGH